MKINVLLAVLMVWVGGQTMAQGINHWDGSTVASAPVTPAQVRERLRAIAQRNHINATPDLYVTGTLAAASSAPASASVLTATPRPRTRPQKVVVRRRGLSLPDDENARLAATRAFGYLPYAKGTRASRTLRPSGAGYVLADNSLRAEVNVSTQRMVLKEAGRIIAEWPVSTGKKGYASTRGEFNVSFLSRNHKSKQYNNAPMPCAVFYNGGEAIHGTNALDQLGQTASHGCVRLETQNACALYDMVAERGKQSLVVSVFD